MLTLAMCYCVTFEIAPISLHSPEWLKNFNDSISGLKFAEMEKNFLKSNFTHLLIAHSTVEGQTKPPAEIYGLPQYWINERIYTTSS